jgi:hypothetical protein
MPQINGEHFSPAEEPPLGLTLELFAVNAPKKLLAGYQVFRTEGFVEYEYIRKHNLEISPRIPLPASFVAWHYARRV